jgi:CheY-like chemotaxis protein
VFDLRSLISCVVSTMKGQADQKSVRIVVDGLKHYSNVDESALAFYGDKFRLEHVILNFISNAIKFSEEGGQVKLVVRLEKNVQMKRSLWTTPNPTPRTMVTVLVVDHGVGISEENQKKLFVPFAQVRAGDERVKKGTGLGLVLAKEIIHLHGGQLIVRSGEGEGSTFGFKIPLLPAEYAPQGDQAQAQGDPLALARSPSSPSPQDENNQSKSKSKMKVGSPQLSGAIQGLHHAEPLQRDPVEVTPVDNKDGHKDKKANASSDDATRALEDKDRHEHDHEHEEETRPVAKAGPAALAAAAKLISGEFSTKNSVKANGNANDYNRMNFLLVDDTMSNSMMLKILLNRKGIDCDTAANGQRAVFLYKESLNTSTDRGARKAFTYDVIFMDQTMPVMVSIRFAFYRYSFSHSFDVLTI